MTAERLSQILASQGGKLSAERLLARQKEADALMLKLAKEDNELAWALVLEVLTKAEGAGLVISLKGN